MSLLKDFDINMFRVECPVCKSRRPLSDSEKEEFRSTGDYWSFQFCRLSCQNRASENQKNKTIKSNPKGETIT